MRLVVILVLCATVIVNASHIKLVVFVHGTIGLRHHLSFKTFFTLMSDSVEHTLYKKSINLVRNDPFFYQNQTMQQLGFVPVKQKPEKHRPVAALFAELYEALTPNKEEDGKTIYYTFGWSGLASHSERLKSAHQFYFGLQNLIEEIEEKHAVTPTIEIVGYSHGATVVLLCEEIRQKFHEDPPFIIDRFMLLGAPIQADTEHYICSPLFKKIFHFYSRSDNIQCLDCFSTKRFFSRRRFSHRSYCALPDSLHQVEIRITTRADSKKKSPRINKSPGHMELWFFGWPQTMYRSSFPFNPLPVAVLLPALADIAEHKTDDKHIVIDLQPDRGSATIRPRFSYRLKRVPFYSYAKLKPYQERALKYKPDHFTETLYNAHVHNAINLAYDVKALKRSSRKKSICGS